jgi:hypothetical protein
MNAFFASLWNHLRTLLLPPPPQTSRLVRIHLPMNWE